jgi:hypothetical protein
LSLSTYHGSVIFYKGNNMGEVNTEITLVNIEDKEVAGRGHIPQDQVRRLTINAVVDTGA